MTVQIELDPDGLTELRHEIGEDVCADLAADIASRCGDGYGYRVAPLTWLTLATVYTATQEAALDNAENDTLVNSL